MLSFKSSPAPLKCCLRVQAAVDLTSLEAPAQLAYPETAMIPESSVSKEAAGLGSPDAHCSLQEMLKAGRRPPATLTESQREKAFV